MGERHVTDAELVEVAQQTHAVLNGVAAFDTHQRRDFALFVNADDVIGAQGQQLLRRKLD